MEIKCNFCRASFLYPIDNLESQYTYNIRGWLKGINNTLSFNESGSPTDLFAFRIGYNDVEGISTPLYNGNIGETYWKTHPENVLRKYSYEYDDLNRLTDAYYQKPGLAPSQTYAYDEYLSYDKNGNILSMDRNGYLDSNVAPYLIDKLNYSYGLNSNRLDYVVDQSNSIDGFKDGQNADPSRPDYSYDLNGNMTQDWNKGISEITYNHLNLPTQVIFNYDVNKKIDYLYNALGVKLRKVVVDKTVTPNINQETHYLGGFQYVGNDLQFFPTAEGYVSVKESIYNYVYNYTDHLGNIRLSYTREGSLTKVLEENHYYPFGMKHSYNADIREWGLDRDTGEVYAIVEEVDRSNYQYKYNGKEFQDELGLNFYDYGARNYDPAIGRWMNIDNKAESGFMLSPYQHSFNNPVMFIDRDGNWSVSVHFNMTCQALSKAGFNHDVSYIIGHYSSVYADHPSKAVLALNNLSNRTSVGFHNDIDYSPTRNSQQIDYDPQKSTTYNYNIWHSMRSNKEAVLFGSKKFGGISKKDAMLRGLGFGWGKIFESANEGKMSDFKKNSKGLQDLGQGLHALQDAWAHTGVSMDEHDVLNDAFNTSGNRKEAEALTESAITVHKLISGDWTNLGDSVNIRMDGMNDEQKQQAMSAAQAYLKTKK